MHGRGKTPVVAVTAGDFNGIGPEVVLKSINAAFVRKICRPLLVGPAGVFEYYSRRLRIPLHSVRIIESSGRVDAWIRPGEISARSGRAAYQALEAAVELVKQRKADAIVTAPVSKQALHRARVDFPGQTEIMQHLSGSRRVAMMLVSGTMRVGLATIHIPIGRVPRVLTKELLREKIDIVWNALAQDWRIRSPRIAVLALNPHASEGGDIGREDLDIVQPVIAQIRKRGRNIAGPFPADAFFGRYRKDDYDAIIAMYHDQGLIPLKMSSFGSGVNISVGMNIVRTSPDHGTAFDIAGKGVADPSSMIEAIALAAQVATNRVAINRGIVRKRKRV